MDGYEATKIVFSRIQSLDPDNASKIMGLLLIRDHGEKEMIRLAFGPETLVHSVILKAKKELGLLSNTPSTPSTPSPSPFSNLLSLSRQNSSSPSGSSRLLGGVNLPCPLSIPNHHSSVAPTPRGNSSFSDFQNPEDLVIPSPSSASASALYSAAVSNCMATLAIGSTSSSMNSAAPPFYGGGETNLIDEFHLQDHLSFLNNGSPTQGPKSSDFFYPQADLTSSPSGSESMLLTNYAGATAANWGGSGNGLPHRRSFSVSDISLGSEDPAGGFGWKPCLYFARGYCKNGTSCKFLHGGVGEVGMLAADGSPVVGSPSKFEIMDQCQELIRSKTLQKQRLAAASSQFMASANFPHSPVDANKCMDFIFQQQQLQADKPELIKALMMNENMHKFGRSRLDKNDFGMNGSLAMMNTVSRQIYLTFPADSTFKEEDVSNYFSNFGPVQDVRIPYQQKRMFGFVTFVYPETVKLILAKGNPHFVCDARVLVKPYKEKGKIPDKFRKQQQLQQLERGEFGGCGSTTGLDSRDPFALGTRVFYNTQDMWRRKLEEQADLQQVIELQSRRLMSLQLDVMRNNHHRTFSIGSHMLSPSFSQTHVDSSDLSSPEVIQENGSGPVMGSTTITVAADERLQKCANLTEKEKQSSTIKEGNGSGKYIPRKEESEFSESLEHNLPDSPFESPKATGDYITTFSAGEPDKKAATSSPSLANNGFTNTTLLPPTSSLDITPLRSCYFEASSLSSGHGAIGM